MPPERGSLLQLRIRPLRGLTCRDLVCLPDTCGRMFGRGDDDQQLDMTPSPRQAASHPISICGWLYKMKRKQRAFLPAWVQRWFTVEDGHLHWYGSKSEPKSRGSISLMTVSAVKEFESGEGVFSFVIYSTERTLLLRGVNRRDLDRWVGHLRLQLEYLKGTSGVDVGQAGGASFDRRNIQSKSKTGFDKMIGRLDAALEDLAQLEEEVGSTLTMISCMHDFADIWCMM